MKRKLPRIRLSPSLTAILAALLAAVLLSLLSADHPIRALRSFFFTPILNRYHLGNMISYASLLMFTGGGVILAFTSGSFNLGGEGQTYLAALVSAVLLVGASGPAVVLLPAVFLCSALVAATLAGLSGFLRHQLGADELITSFLLSAATIPVLDYLIAGPLRDGTGNLLATPVIGTDYRLLPLLLPSQLSVALIVALLFTLFLGILIRFTLFGYEMRIVGLNRQFARYGGLRTGIYSVVPMALSGAWHGLAGAALVTGIHFRAISGFTAGLGWNGIAVALIARNRPILLVPAALLFAYLNAGSSAAVIESQATWEFGAILQAVVFLFVTAQWINGRSSGSNGL